MGGTLSEILHLPLEQRAELLLIITLREILMQAHLEDCLNNAWTRARQDGIYGPDAEFRLLFKGETTYE